jgi:hypothetical protein
MLEDAKFKGTKKKKNRIRWRDVLNAGSWWDGEQIEIFNELVGSQISFKRDQLWATHVGLSL